MEFMEFKPGCLPDTPDDRDLLYEERVGAGEPFDWNKGYDVEEEMGVKLKVENQNGSYSCVGQGISKYAEILNFFDEGVLRDLSAKDIYSHIFLPGGCAMIRDGMDWLVNHGVEEEQYVPSYDKGKAPSEAFMETIVPRNEERAKKYKALSYLTTTHNEIDFVAMMIRDNHGIVTSYDVDSANWKAKILTPPKGKAEGHCVCMCKAKLIDGKKYIGFPNSGGTKIGDNGWQWMGEDYFGFLNNIWTLRDLITNQENMIVDEAKLNQIYQEELMREPDEAAKAYIGQEESFVREEIGKSEERQKLITLVNAARNV